MVDYSQAEASSLPGAERLSTQEAARELGVSKATLLRWIKDGKITDVKRDRNNWRVFTLTTSVRSERRWD